MGRRSFAIRGSSISGLSVVGGGALPDLYVATDGDDDTGDGTLALPYLTIAKAVTVAPTTGAIIHIADGTYTLTDAVSVTKAKLQFIGASRAGTIITSADTKNAFSIGADDVMLMSLTVDGRRASGGTGNGVAVTSAQRTIIDDCLIKNTTSQGIIVNGDPNSNYGILRNSTISNLGITKATAGGYLAGIQIISGGSYWKIHDNTFTGWSQAIGLWYTCSYCEVYDNTLIDNYGYADAGHTVPRSALEVYPADSTGGHHHIYDNTINGSTLHCIEDAQGDNASLFERNILSNWTTSPIVCVDGGDLQINQNCIFDANECHAAGINGVITLAGRGTIYRNNIHTGFSNAGTTTVVSIYGTFDGLTVSGNTFDDCKRPITAGGGNGHTITGNVMTNGTAATSTSISVTTGNGHTISGNTITHTETGRTGINISGGSGHTLQDNVVHTKSNALAISVADCIVGGVGHGNTITADTTVSVYAIQCTGAGATGNTITYNTVDAVDAWGAMGFLSGATGNTFIHNTILHGAITAGTGNTTTPNP